MMNMVLKKNNCFTNDQMHFFFVSSKTTAFSVADDKAVYSLFIDL